MSVMQSSKWVHDFLVKSTLTISQVELFLETIAQDAELATFLEAYAQGERPTFTPLFIFNEREGSAKVLVVDLNQQAPEPGEPNSILAVVRCCGLGERYMYSDCYGQLSCSSCAVEVLAGNPANPVPREEEYDMLDIDDKKPPTAFTRLGCQTIVGREPLILKIRA